MRVRNTASFVEKAMTIHDSITKTNHKNRR